MFSTRLGKRFITSYLRSGANAVGSGVNVVTDAIGSTKDDLIASAVLQNVNTLNAIKQRLKDRGDRDSLTIRLTVTTGIATIDLSTQYTPEPQELKPVVEVQRTKTYDGRRKNELYMI